METITISKQEYKRLKKIEKKIKLDENDIVEQLQSSLEDLKKGRFKRVA